MGWASAVLGGLLLTLVLISIATTLAGFLLVTHQSCVASSTTTNSGFLLFGETSNSSSTTTGLNDTNSSAAAPSLLPVPVPVVADDLSLAPLGGLSLTKGNGSTTADLSNLTFWQQVQASEYQTYEEIVPQTVMGFFNSSEEWRDWAQQYIPDSGSWLATGFVTDAQGRAMAVEPTSGGAESSTAVAQGIQEFAASAAGVTLASLDFVSLNGLTAFKTLFETGDATLAACQTLPGQLAQLYESSVDSGVPQDERAQYLGRALAITSVMLLIGGKDGFADQFQGALDGVGLGDSWPAVKPYLGDIASKVSASASSATFTVLQTLAQRFPQDSAFVTGFTADRIDSMVDVLQKSGVSDGVIQSDIGQIAQAAATSPDETGAGDATDILSLQQGRGIEATVESDGSLVRYEDGAADTVYFDGDFLQHVLPGFDPRGPEFVAIHYQEAGLTVYQYYQIKAIPAGAPYGAANTNWYPVVPKDVAQPGAKVTVSFQLLTPEDFVQSIPPIPLENIGASWVTDFSEITGFELAGDQVVMNVEQDPFEGVSDFAVAGQAMPLTNVGGDTFIEFAVPDLVNQPETLKITYDGYGDPLLSIKSSSNFNPVTLISSDGVKLKFAYNSGGSSVAVATEYLQQPSVLWTLGGISQEGLGFAVPGASRTFRIGQVTPVRDLEKEMVNSGSPYDLARVGAEIAYTIAQEDFDVQNIQLNEPPRAEPTSSQETRP
jgi:hypothetical protein